MDDSSLKTYNMALTKFLIKDSLEKIWFIEEMFLLTNTSIEVVLGMLFLFLNNANIRFGNEKLTLTSYTIVKILPTTSWIKLINKRKFTKIVLDKNSETFVIYIPTLEAMQIHFSRAFKVQKNPTLAALQVDETLTKVLIKYSNMMIFSSLTWQ